MTALLEHGDSRTYALAALKQIDGTEDIGGTVMATATYLPPAKPSTWPLVLYGVLAAGAVWGFLWARSASSLEHALKTGQILKQGDADLIQAVCIGLIIGAVVGIVIQSIRFAKATPNVEAPMAVTPSPFVPKEPSLAPSSDHEDMAEALRKLTALKEEGLVTDEEFAAKKAEILSRL